METSFTVNEGKVAGLKILCCPWSAFKHENTFGVVYLLYPRTEKSTRLNALDFV